MKNKELEHALNVILNYIDDKPNTRPLFHELVNFWQQVYRQEKEEEE